MTTRQIAATVSIGGSVNSTLGKSFNAVKSAMSGISGELKAIKELTKELEKQSAAAKKAGKDTKKYEEQLTHLAQRRAALEAKNAKFGKISSLFSEPGKIRFGAVPSAILSRLATSKTFGGITTSVLGKIAEYGPILMSVATIALGAVAAIAAVTVGLFMLGKSAAENIHHTKELADGLGIATNKLLGLRYAAARSGIESEKFDMKMNKFNLSVQKAKDSSSDAGKVLTELGLSYQELNAMNMDEAFLAFSTAMHDYTGNMSKAKMANAFFGRGSATMAAMANKGGDALRKEMGNAMQYTEEQIHLSDEFDSKWQTSLANFGSMWTSIGTALLPVINLFLDLGNSISETFSSPEVRANIAFLGTKLVEIGKMMYLAMWPSLKIMEGIFWVLNKIVTLGREFADSPIGKIAIKATNFSGWLFDKLSPTSVSGDTSNHASLPESVTSGSAVSNSQSSSTNNNNQNVTINVSGSANPTVTAQEIYDKLKALTPSTVGSYN